MKSIPAQNPGIRIPHAQKSSSAWAAIERELRRAFAATPLAILLAAVRSDGLTAAEAARSREGCNVH